LTRRPAADSLAPKRVGELMFPIARALVERGMLATTMPSGGRSRRCGTRRIVAKPGGSAAVAALQSGACVPAAGERIGIVIWGQYDGRRLRAVTGADP
jgi:threonine dehydratase